MFYHRFTSEQLQQESMHRADQDGTIDEVEMTTQGASGPIEREYGWMLIEPACSMAR